MSNGKHDVIGDIIRFLENEKEMYGPFSIEPEAKLRPSESTLNPEAPKQKTDKGLAEQRGDEQKKNLASGSEDQARTIQQKLANCSTLDELHSLCSASELLKTDLEGTNLVFGVGNPNADLMIIGEAPGFNEDKEGEPFVGAAGQLLNKILRAIDFSRKDVYIANILKHRPPDNRNPLAEERERSLPFLLRQIDLISPKIILCVGKVSATTLLDKDEALKRMRGKFYPFRGAELTVTYHPAALLRNKKWKRPTWEDVQAVRKRYDELGGKP
ncbi:MAG: uracil-DNA glycosylase [Bacteroidetes bacterium]|jgi:DNA polymerase|nr:uracil-DNA glycosylase [Bacteroidota bacterium]